MAAPDLPPPGREREAAFAHLISRRDRRRLGQLIRDARIQAGLQQSDLAARLEVPQSVLSKLETGQRELAVLELKVICTALGIPLSTFIALLDRDLSEHLGG